MTKIYHTIISSVDIKLIGGAIHCVLTHLVK